MYVKVIFAFLIVAVVAMVNADYEINKAVLNYFLLAKIMEHTGQCLHYNTRCTNSAQCCQYWDQQAKMGCMLDGRCLQSVCGYPNQQCGWGIGDCCYHLGLVCKYVSFGYSTCQGI